MTKYFKIKQNCKTVKDNYIDKYINMMLKLILAELKCVSVGRLLVVICEGINLMSTNNDGKMRLLSVTKQHRLIKFQETALPQSL